MAIPSREVQSAARRAADRHRAQLAEIAGARHAMATVATVTPGGASDGNALARVSWRDAVLEAAVLDPYTPVIGHRVLIVVADNQLIILGRVIGSP